MDSENFHLRIFINPANLIKLARDDAHSLLMLDEYLTLQDIALKIQGLLTRLDSRENVTYYTNMFLNAYMPLLEDI